MALSYSYLRDKAMRGALGGIYLYLAKKEAEYTERFFKPRLKKWHNPVVKAGTGIIVDYIPMVRESRYLAELGDYLLADGARDFVEIVVDNPTDLWLEGNDTIHVINFGETLNALYIDGTQQASTAYTIEGTANDFKIKLSAALAKGEHTVLVVGTKNAIAKKVNV
jgi:hypothetical protein